MPRVRLQEILDQAMGVGEAAAGKLRLVVPESDVLELRAWRGFSDDFIAAFRALRLGDSAPTTRAAKLRRRVSIADLAKDYQAEVPLVTAARAEGMRAMQATPILAPDGRVVGTLSTWFTEARPISASAGIALDHYAASVADLLGAGV